MFSELIQYAVYAIALVALMSVPGYSWCRLVFKFERKLSAAERIAFSFVFTTSVYFVIGLYAAVFTIKISIISVFCIATILTVIPIILWKYVK